MEIKEMREKYKKVKAERDNAYIALLDQLKGKHESPFDRELETLRDIQELINECTRLYRDYIKCCYDRINATHCEEPYIDAEKHKRIAEKCKMAKYELENRLDQLYGAVRKGAKDGD